MHPPQSDEAHFVVISIGVGKSRRNANPGKGERIVSICDSRSFLLAKASPNPLRLSYKGGVPPPGGGPYIMENEHA